MIKKIVHEARDLRLKEERCNQRRYGVSRPKYRTPLLKQGAESAVRHPIRKKLISSRWCCVASQVHGDGGGAPVSGSGGH